MRFGFRVFVMAALALMLAVGVSAQLSKGFRGRVLDKDGKPLAGVTVIFADEANPSNHYEVKTDGHGEYIQIGVPYSDKGYKITTQIPGLPLMGMILKPKLMSLIELIFDPRRCVGFQGTVKDKQGKTVQGATVTIVDLANEAHPYLVKTDSKGVYRKTDLPCSDKGYQITIQLPGEQPLTKSFGMPPEMVGQPERPLEGEPVVFQVFQMVLLEVPLNYANPNEGGGTAAAGPPAATDASDAKQMFELGDYEGALAKAEKAIVAADNIKAAKLIKASCLERLERNDEAVVALEEYNKDFPGDMNVLGTLYKLYDKKGDKAKAETYKKEFLAKGGQISGQTYNEGVQALNAGNAAKAADLFKQAIKENPGDADGHRELARCYAQLGRFQETIDELNLYLKMKPNAEDAETWKQAIAGLQQAIQQQHKK